MINIVASSGNVSYGVQNLVLDTPTDLTQLGTNFTVGSTAFIISTSERYMLNSQKEWVLIQSGNGGSGGGGDIDPDATYIYDGGVII